MHGQRQDEKGDYPDRAGPGPGRRADPAIQVRGDGYPVAGERDQGELTVRVAALQRSRAGPACLIQERGAATSCCGGHSRSGSSGIPQSNATGTFMDPCTCHPMVKGTIVVQERERSLALVNSSGSECAGVTHQLNQEVR